MRISLTGDLGYIASLTLSLLAKMDHEIVELNNFYDKPIK